MDFADLEQQVLRSWRSGDILGQSLKKATGKRPFIFYEGPPSANAKPGIHHVLARSFKDLMPRFKTMRGYQVERRAGWDTHGLPIEVQAEKELGLQNKKDIERYGVAKFNAYCRELVFRYQKDWEQLTERIGFWLDLKHPYITYESSYISELWGVIKQFHDKGLLYKGHKVVPHCPRCGTSLSSHEVAQGYEEVTEPSVYVKFRLMHGKFMGSFIVAWTTTPWTLPGNVALAVAQNLTYVWIAQGNEKLIVAKEALSRLGLTNSEVIDEFRGSELLAEKYEPLFDVLKPSQKTPRTHSIMAADFVNVAEGTGVVHTAVMYGEDDYQLGESVGLPKVHTVAEDGTFKDFVKPFAGTFVKDADKAIIKDLKDRGLVLKVEDYTHSYPFCWRCGTPLLYYAKDSWFLAMSTLRGQLLKNNAEIVWVPRHLREGRFGEFLREAKDWAFSRERYWGTPLPVWLCKSGHAKVVGSAAELPKKLDDLHRPFIDDITFECSECKATMRREPYVVDGWFDSGAMPYASGEKKAGRFPADFIAEGIDQTRGWFYTLLAVSTALGDGPSYKTVISNGLVLDEKGKKMSKSKGNVIYPETIIEKHGADALRWYFYIMNQPGDNKAFVEKDLVTYKNKTLGLLWNVYAYYETYSKPETSNQKPEDNPKFNILDRWITVRLHETIKQVTSNLEHYQITEAARSIMALIEDTSTWYLRRSRGRQDNEFFDILRTILATIAKLIAPFMPFNADALYQKFEKESVHLQDWPNSDPTMIDQKLIADMTAVRTIVSEALKLRSDKNIRVRQPLSQLTIINQQLTVDLRELIADELNVKKIVVGRGVALDTAITPELREEGIAREVIRSIQDLRKQAGYGFSDEVRAFYETSDKTTNQALGTHRTMIESETLASFEKGIPKTFDKELKTETLHLAVSSAQ